MKVLARGDAAEVARVVDEMRLVAVAVPDRDCRPINVDLTVEGADHSLEASYPGEALGR